MLRTSGAAYGEFVELVIRAAVDPAQGMSDAFDGAAELLELSGFIDPCPIGTIAREVASTHEPLRQVAAAVMNGWFDTILAIFLEAGISESAARSLASVSIASIEGGFILARTHGDTLAWFSIGQFLSEAIRRELPDLGDG